MLTGQSLGDLGGCHGGAVVAQRRARRQNSRPVCSEMWPGNIADVTTLLPVIDRLRQRFAIGRAPIPKNSTLIAVTMSTIRLRRRMVGEPTQARARVREIAIRINQLSVGIQAFARRQDPDRQIAYFDILAVSLPKSTRFDNVSDGLRGLFSTPSLMKGEDPHGSPTGTRPNRP
jgi:hypothetical protein